MKSIHFIILLSTALAVEGKILSRFERNGFIFLGNLTNHLDSTKVLSLWLGPDEKDQNSAIITCKDMGGQLLSIFNLSQDEDVRQFIVGHAERGSFWTAGLFDEGLGEYVWDTFSMEIGYKNFRQEATCREDSSVNNGIVVGGLSSQYGWCSALTNTQLPYICKE